MKGIEYLVTHMRDLTLRHRLFWGPDSWLLTPDA